MSKETSRHWSADAEGYNPHKKAKGKKGRGGRGELVVEDVTAFLARATAAQSTPATDRAESAATAPQAPLAPPTPEADEGLEPDTLKNPPVTPIPITPISEVAPTRLSPPQVDAQVLFTLSTPEAESGIIEQFRIPTAEYPLFEEYIANLKDTCDVETVSDFETIQLFEKITCTVLRVQREIAGTVCTASLLIVHRRPDLNSFDDFKQLVITALEKVGVTDHLPDHVARYFTKQLMTLVILDQNKVNTSVHTVTQKNLAWLFDRAATKNQRKSKEPRQQVADAPETELGRGAAPERTDPILEEAILRLPEVSGVKEVLSRSIETLYGFRMVAVKVVLSNDEHCTVYFHRSGNYIFKIGQFYDYLAETNVLSGSKGQFYAELKYNKQILVFYGIPNRVVNLLKNIEGSVANILLAHEKQAQILEREFSPSFRSMIETMGYTIGWDGKTEAESVGKIKIFDIPRRFAYLQVSMGAKQLTLIAFTAQKLDSSIVDGPTLLHWLAQSAGMLVADVVQECSKRGYILVLGSGQLLHPDSITHLLEVQQDYQSASTAETRLNA